MTLIRKIIRLAFFVFIFLIVFVFSRFWGDKNTDEKQSGIFNVNTADADTPHFGGPGPEGGDAGPDGGDGGGGDS